MWQAMTIFAVVLLIYRYFITSFKKKAPENLSISFSADHVRCREKEPVRLSLLIQNHKMMFLPIIKIVITMPDSFDGTSSDIDFAIQKRKTFTTVTSLRSFQQVLSEWEVMPQQRGYYEIEARITLVNLFNTTRVELAELPPVNLIVHPTPVDIEKRMLNSSSSFGENFVNRFINPDPMFYLGTRDYLAGDSFKDIEWKKTAQLGKMQVKKYEYTSQPEFTVLLLAEDNAGLNYDHDPYVESAVRLAAGVVDFAYRNKISVQFGCNNYGKFHRISTTAEFTHANIVNIYDELSCCTGQIKLKSEELMNIQNVIVNKGYIIICNKYKDKYAYFIKKWLAQSGSVHLFVYDDSAAVSVRGVTVSKLEVEA
ncbi:MAG: DUF58 domain-containing protein [Erysipelotrichaceae bacterium]|nr:DUF58 domain-containing protein [Erysipelotrichaceae bacterium]